MVTLDERPPEALTPRSFADLRAVLDDLSRAARGALGKSLVGVYLVGSFAVGHGDEHSDVDFLVVTEQDVDAAHEQALRDVHARFPDSPVGWAQHLEGSYVPRSELRRPGTSRGAWLYVDNGSRDLERSSHDDTAVTRWVLREHGVTLAGPDPVDLVDPVTADQLREEALATIGAWQRSLARDPDDIATAWGQQHEVLGLCRFLYTVVTGSVTSKIPGGRWALGALDPRWHGLIQRAIDDRPDPWGRVHRPADPALLDPTRRFVEYVHTYALGA